MDADEIKIISRKAAKGAKEIINNQSSFINPRATDSHGPARIE
jgi:hypothetical protein